MLRKECLKAVRLTDGGSQIRHCEVCDEANQCRHVARYFRRKLLVANYLCHMERGFPLCLTFGVGM
jgi:hypothetical protein